MEGANNQYRMKEYSNAAEQYRALKSKEERGEAAFKAAESYRIYNNYKKAQDYYERAKRYKYKDPSIQYRIGEMLKAQCEYEDAIIAFQKYKKDYPLDTMVDKQIQGCELALKWIGEESRYIVEPFKPANSRENDFAPTYADKKFESIYFTSDRDEGYNNKRAYGWTGNKYMDIWMVNFSGRRGQQAWQKPELVEDINGDWNDGATNMDGRYRTVYYTVCGEPGETKESGRTCRMYSRTRKGKANWGDPEPMPFNSDEYNVGHPFISADGKTLYFSSDMPDSKSGDKNYGGRDLWMVKQAGRGRTWGDPINLGPNVNTTGDEVYPYIHEDGTLYFASDGHPGMGQLDIFYTTGEAQHWEKPTNMKAPINSCGDDFAIIFEPGTKRVINEKGYFTSNREGGRGGDDIYEFHQTPLECSVKGVVYVCAEGASNGLGSDRLENSTVTITNSCDTNTITVTTDAQGEYYTELPCGCKYELKATNYEGGFLPSKSFYLTSEGLENSMHFEQDFCLEIFDLLLVPIYYGLDSANIYTREESMRVLDTLIMTLEKFPKFQIELGSHTDCRSSYAYNDALSQRRADSAVSYLVTHGLHPGRVVAKGYGERVLKNDCACEGGVVSRPCTEEEHQLNRRTEAKVIGYKFNAAKWEEENKDNYYWKLYQDEYINKGKKKEGEEDKKEEDSGGGED